MIRQLNIEQIIAGCKSGKRVAQRALYMQYKDGVYLLSLKYCRNKDEAADNLHDTFITVFESIGKYNGKGSLEGWIKRIAINKAIDKFKNNIRMKDEMDVTNEVETNLDSSGFNIDLQQLLELIRQLPDRYRLVFNLYQLDDYSHKEIGSMLGISEGTSKSNYHRAKIILRDKINELINPAPTTKES